MAKTEVTTRDNADRSRVEATTPSGEVAGYAAYVLRDGVYEFNHTVVNEEFEGQGIGSQLVSGALEFAREQGAKVIPTCTFVRSYMGKNTDTHDLLAEGAEL